MRLSERHSHRGLHGHGHVDHQRRTALLMIITGLTRVGCWLALIVCYAVGVHFTKALFASVSFVALISLYANMATDWGQVAASLAQLTAGDAHADVEHNRRALDVDFDQLEADVARLAELAPGPAAQRLASQIRSRLAGS